MAITEKEHGTSAAGRRFFFGTNVTILMLLVLFLTVALNWLGHWKNIRSDLAGGFSSHRLSDRAKHVIANAKGDIRLTTVYTSDEPDTSRKKYLPKLQDLCEEIRQLNRNVTIEHLHSGNQRAELRDRVQSKFGSAAQQYDKAVTLADSVWGELATALAPVRQEIDKIVRDDKSWLSGFTTLARHASRLQKDLDDIGETKQEVDSLVHREGIPLYQEANRKIKEANDQLKKDLEATRDWLKKMDELAGLLADPNSEFATRTREQVGVLDMLMKNLARAAGDPEDANVPDEPKPVLQAVAKAANALSSALVEESGRVNAFVKANPAMEQHPDWLVGVRQGPLVIKMPLTLLLAETAEDLSGKGQGIRQVLMQEQRRDQLQHYVREMRKVAPQVEQLLDVWKTNVLAILDEGTHLDADSKALLARGSAGELFKEVLDRLKEVSTKIDDLPELELDDIAERLQEDNIVVVESGDEVSVVKFDEVWPLADPLAGRMGMADKESEQRRVFDGDAAISGALLSMQTDKPFATVIFVGYETEPSPQMRQFGQRLNTGRIPLSELSALKERLELANFAVKEWNLGAEGDDAAKPEPEEGTRAIYVFLPPASPMPPNPMMRQPPEKSFGKAELDQVRGLLADKEGARAVFLAAWELSRMSMFGPMPPVEYPYNGLLKEDWGIEAHCGYRLLRLVPDSREVDRYAIDVEQISHMQLSSFTDHPIGKPLRARRVLMADVCPVTTVRDSVTATGTIPDGVTITPVLKVPESTHDLWAEDNEGIRRISDILRSGERRGLFAKDPQTSWEPPFSVILAARKAVQKSGEEAPENAGAETRPAGRAEPAFSRIVVMGTGVSVADFHLTRRVPRFEGKRARFVTDPPPTENAELFVNAVYWLSGEENMIAAGPAEVPLVPVLEPGTQKRVWLIAAGWAFAVLIAGGVVVLVRRK